MPPIRLNKYLASIGIASRRQIDLMTSQNRITINDKVATLGQKVVPSDIIKVDSILIRHSTLEIRHFYYFLLNKPPGYLSTTSDTHVRPTVLDLVKSPVRLFPVGRLDADSSGLILLTNCILKSLRHFFSFFSLSIAEWTSLVSSKYTSLLTRY